MKILFIGLGSIGQRHLRNIISLNKKSEIYRFSETDRQMIISDNLKKAKKTNIDEKYRIQRLKNINEIKKIKPNITFICNPSSKHMKFALIAAKNKSHIFIEKPLSNNLRSVKNLMNIVNKNKIICFVGYNMKFNPIIIFLKKIINNNKYGNLLFIKSNFGKSLNSFHPYENINKVIYSKKDLGGGVVLEISHEIDFIKWIIGEEPHYINSISSTVGNNKIDVENLCFSHFAFKKKNRNIFANLNLDMTQMNDERNLTLSFDKSTIKVNLTNNEIFLFNDKNEKIILSKYRKFKRNEMYISELKYFFDCIKKRKKNHINDLKNAVSTLKISLNLKKNYLSLKN